MDQLVAFAVGFAAATIVAKCLHQQKQSDEESKNDKSIVPTVPTMPTMPTKTRLEEILQAWEEVKKETKTFPVAIVTETSGEALMDLPFIMNPDKVYSREFGQMFAQANDLPIDIILHTNGMSSTDCTALCLQILNSRARGQRVHIYVPYVAASAGTLVALSGDLIYCNWYTLFGPTDCQSAFKRDHAREAAHFAVDYEAKVGRKLRSDGLLSHVQVEAAKLTLADDRRILESIVQSHVAGMPDAHSLDVLLQRTHGHDWCFTPDFLAANKICIIKTDMNHKYQVLLDKILQFSRQSSTKESS